MVQHGLTEAAGVSRTIFMVLLLMVLPLPVPAEVAPVPVDPVPTGATGTNRIGTGLTQTQAPPALEQLKSEVSEKPPSAAASNPEAPAAEPNPPCPSPCVESAGFAYGWLALSFAMLILGFVAGVVWLRERNRKKLGGMYLRI